MAVKTMMGGTQLQMIFSNQKGEGLYQRGSEGLCVRVLTRERFCAIALFSSDCQHSVRVGRAGMQEAGTVEEEYRLTAQHGA